MAVGTKDALHDRFAKTAIEIVSQKCIALNVSLKYMDWVV